MPTLAQRLDVIIGKISILLDELTNKIDEIDSLNKKIREEYILKSVSESSIEILNEQKIQLEKKLSKGDSAAEAKIRELTNQIQILNDEKINSLEAINKLIKEINVLQKDTEDVTTKVIEMEGLVKDVKDDKVVVVSSDGRKKSRSRRKRKSVKQLKKKSKKKSVKHIKKKSKKKSVKQLKKKSKKKSRKL